MWVPGKVWGPQTRLSACLCRTQSSRKVYDKAREGRKVSFILNIYLTSPTVELRVSSQLY